MQDFLLEVKLTLIHINSSASKESGQFQLFKDMKGSTVFQKCESHDYSGNMG